MELRYYQKESIQAIYDYFADNDGHPCVSVGTGLGKSLIAAEFVRGALEAYPETKIHIVVPTQELVEQNYGELINLWPKAPAGIYCSGLGRKDKDAPIVLGTIQSIYKANLPTPDLIIADEAHAIPKKDNGMWKAYIGGYEAKNSDLRVIGLTATPFRMDSGRLDEGDDRLFDKVVYDYGIKEGVLDGFLAPLTTKGTKTTLDVSNVGTRGGEFISGELQRAVDVEEINEAIIQESIERAGDRKSWLFFATGITHAEHLAALLCNRGVKAEALTSADNKIQRRNKIEAFRNGEIKALCSMNILTTGFNVKGVDFIAMVRPTKSAGLLVQMMGRGTRLAEGKENCYVADFSGNLKRHGPIDLIDGRKRKGKGEAPMKECPECEELLYLVQMTCTACGYKFPEPEYKPKYRAGAAADVILSTDKKTLLHNHSKDPQELEVSDVKYSIHTKMDSPDSLKVTYTCGFTDFSEWIHFEIPGGPKFRAQKWWKARTHLVFPETAQHAYIMKDRLAIPRHILVIKNGKYWNVVGYRWKSAASAEEKAEASGGMKIIA